MNKNSKLAIHIILFLTVFWSCTSCNSNDPRNDSDSVSDNDTMNDIDSIKVDVDDLSDEVLTESDEIVDSDSDSDTNSDGDCPALKSASFPYYREDGSIHFCRKCDLPAKSDDPDCVRNIWKEKNEQYANDYPDQECAGYPCVVETLKSKKNPDDAGKVGLTECDIDIVPKYFSGGNSNGLHFGIDDGKVGFYMVSSSVDYFNYPTSTRAFEYDIKTDEYKAVFPATSSTLSYFKGSFVGTVYDSRKTFDPENQDKPNEFLIYYSPAAGYKVISKKTVDVLPYSLVRLGEKYAAVVIKDDGGVYELRYARVGEWKWQKIEGATGYENYIVIEKNILAFYNSGMEGYVCDLDKPAKVLADCKKINRGEEKVKYLTIDEDNIRKVAFVPAASPQTIVVADLSGETVKYEEYPTPFTEPGSYITILDKFKGSLILYSEMFNYDDNGTELKDAKACFYRLDKKKGYCAKRISEGHPYYHSYGDFEGKYLMWQSSPGGAMTFRDMECYCKLEPEACPFDEYMPDETSDNSIPDGDVPVYIY
ncbi:MAG TPA: hypothetical protein P5044_05825 [bacterium]|nr:hypothetical protein [bacterium]